MENNYYFLKNIYTNEISYYTEETFKLEFGDKFQHILFNFHINTYLEKHIKILYEQLETIFFMNFVANWNKYNEDLKMYVAISFADLTTEEQNKIINIIDKNEQQEIQQEKQRNQKNKSVGNGQGSLYYSEKLKCWIFQYYEPSGKRKTIKQKKKETVKQFKDRVAELRVSINNGTYIEKRNDTTKTIIEKHIRQKFNDGITQGRAYKRDQETLEELEKCCGDFINKPIQNVTLNDIQESKENMKCYAQSVIDKMWRQLKKAFAIASSPSVKLININIMIDENLKKPISNQRTKKVKPLTSAERKKLEQILDNEERHHKYRNIVKIEWLTGMRIGEVLARSTDDIQENKTILHIHNTITEDENGNTILGEHTKTYNKRTQIDEGERKFPIFTELNEILEEEMAKKIANIYKLIFWNYQTNTFISPQEVNSWLYRLNKKYKISKNPLHNHRLRHDRLTQWKEKGMDMEAIQYLAGHVEGSEVTDSVYIDVSQEYAFEQFKKAL